MHSWWTPGSLEMLPMPLYWTDVTLISCINAFLPPTVCTVSQTLLVIMLQRCPLACSRHWFLAGATYKKTTRTKIHQCVRKVFKEWNGKSFSSWICVPFLHWSALTSLLLLAIMLIPRSSVRPLQKALRNLFFLQYLVAKSVLFFFLPHMGTVFLST